MTILHNVESHDRTFTRVLWEHEYAEYCAAKEEARAEAEAAAEPSVGPPVTTGYVSTHECKDRGQAETMQCALNLVMMLEDLRYCQIEDFSCSINDDGAPEVTIEFYDHYECRYGIGKHIFPTDMEALTHERQ